jgi:hypothetical protein
MDLSQLASWAIAHPELAVVAAGALLSIPGAVYAVVKTAYQAITGRPAKGRVWTVLDVAAEVLPNLPGAINRAVRGAGLPSIFAPPSRDTVAPPPPSDPQRGAVRVGALLAICGAVVVASVVGAVLTGCPRLPPVSGCTPQAYRCTDSGRPEVCSTSQRWEPIGDEPCSASGNVCVVDRTAHCAPMTVTADADGGAL